MPQEAAELLQLQAQHGAGVGGGRFVSWRGSVMAHSVVEDQKRVRARAAQSRLAGRHYYPNLTTPLALIRDRR